MQINVNNGVNGLAADAAVSIDQFGNPLVNIPTYRAGVYDITPASPATDVFTITGSATKTIKITRLQVTADNSNSAGVIDFYCFFRTTANTGGTSTVLTGVPYDTTNPAPTAVVRAYSANPATLGTGTFMFGDHYALANASNSGIPVFPWIEDFGIRNTQPIILRGVNQSFCFSLNGDTVPSGTNIYVSIEWTEE